MPVNNFYTSTILVLALAAGHFLDRMDLGLFLGQFIFGLAIPAGPPLTSALIDKFESLTLGVLLPFQVATSMIRVDLLVIVSRFSYLKYYIGLTCVLFVVKLSACLVPSLYSKMPLIDSVVLAFILSSKGIIELATYSVRKDNGDNPNAVSIHAFTSISSIKFMYEDIGTLALDKVTSLILLPLHRKWSIHGLIRCENHSLRTLNCRVLGKAPCSVGIFFERFKLKKENFKKHGPKRSHLSLCMIFLGGRDDREALILAKRMANNSNANLTVINFIADHDDDDTEFVSDEKVPDFTAIEKVQQISVIDESISYKEHPVKDGPQTALHVHSIADDCDLFIVGRRYGVKSPQTSGLSEWSELPELGIIGDLLASIDLDTEVSVLVVQQQRQMKYLD
ncbi:hypothetical protein GH714_001978 [Hevea brasiliensis]|uniref:Cation/H(+) antiporter C-terminal domain-containing protein n=1 Tax=Hevea brasiliensis TaxID=3981 RepID=A0A6A6NA67_HEVBR|nr:hypothetical protein GH714_001978 [Hevea brasiliensis]